MGLEITDEVVRTQMPVVLQQPAGQVVAASGATGANRMVAPISGTREVGMLRSEIRQGVREVVLCKAANGKIGMAVKSVSKVGGRIDGGLYVGGCYCRCALLIS